MLKQSPLRTLIFIWLAWAVIIIGFQTLVTTRLDIRRPDYAVSWTPNETAFNSQRDKPYLVEPFMNRQVAWDSEFYLSIATVGYDDPDVRVVDIPGQRQGRSMNYAFFPLYPYVMKVVRVPLSILPLTPIGLSTLAGVLVSLVGTFFGMLALYNLTVDELEQAGALRAVFYLLIFPSAFFLALVYTEGLFIGIAFTSLVLIKRKQLVWAAALAFFAPWTRSVGVALIVPLAIVWLDEIGWRKLAITRQNAWHGLLVLSPLVAYGLWHLALGESFTLVEENWFGRGLFNWENLKGGLDAAINAIITGEELQMRIYYMLEFASVGLAFVACLATLRRYPGIALFSLLVLVVSFTSGAPQSLIRYMLVVPSLYIFLARLGRSPAFDRAWTLASILLLGMQTMLFSFDMWVA